MSSAVRCRLPSSKLSTSFLAARPQLRKSITPAIQRKVIQPQAFFGGGGNKAASSSQFYICIDCGYIYDNSAGPWSEIPSYFRCPACNSPKARFKVYKGDDVKGKPNNAKSTMQKRMKEKKW